MISEATKGWAGTVVIVACLALLAFLVHEHAEGAMVAAIAAVTTLIAYFTRPPSSKDPPTGPAIVIATAIGTIVACVGCEPAAPAHPPPTYCTTERSYTDALLACVEAAETWDESRACRARVNADCGITETVTRHR